jgi:dephospho-CoA kinase
MLKVGLTGGLASGKTHVARVLAELGCHVIHADAIGHEALKRGGEAYNEVIRNFGREILGANGEIDRKALAGLVFADPEKLKILNSLVHPYVFRRQQEFFEEVAAKDLGGIAVVEAAIMIEAGSYEKYDRLILAVCPPEMQIKRFRDRENATEEQARARLANQMPLEEKRKYADYVIDTSGSYAETERQVRKVYEQMRREAS